jgi:carbon starvation protein
MAGEESLLSRTGGAPSLAVGMASIFAGVFGGRGMDVWYHFAIMFEALFILTTLDAGTRVGRFMLQDLGRTIWEPFGRTGWTPMVWLSSFVFVMMWGHFLYQGVVDPYGGVNSLWPLFGISNQLLATVALCVGTTVLIKMGRQRYAWVTMLPLAWLVIVTTAAGWQKMFATDPRLGFLSHARMLSDAIASGALPAGIASELAARRMMFNDYLDAAVAGFFLVSVYVVLVASMHEWWVVLSGRKAAVSTEVPFVRRALDVGGPALGVAGD